MVHVACCRNHHRGTQRLASLGIDGMVLQHARLLCGHAAVLGECAACNKRLLLARAIQVIGEVRRALYGAEGRHRHLGKLYRVGLGLHVRARQLRIREVIVQRPRSVELGARKTVFKRRCE